MAIRARAPSTKTDGMVKVLEEVATKKVVGVHMGWLQASAR